MKNKTINKITKILLATSFTVLFGILSVVAIGSRQEAAAQNAFVTPESEIKEIYALNEQFIMPDAVINDSGKVYNVSHSYLIYPDGKAYTRKAYSLNQAGAYTACFVAEADGAQITAEKQFRVYGEAYSVTKAGTCEYREQLNMVDPEIARVGGLGVVLNNGSEFRYNSAIDISKSGLLTPIITVYPYTLTEKLNKPKNYIEANCTIIRLTDAFNENNYVDVEISWDASIDGNNQLYYNYYFRAGTSVERPAGFSLNSTGSVSPWWPTISYNNSLYNIHRKPAALLNPYGPYGTHGTYGYLNADDAGLEIYYEYETKKVYAKDRDNLIFISDLSCKDAYENPFGGFTTGEVYVSVLADYYKENQFNVEIGSIYGLSGEQLNMRYAKDDLPPDVKLSVSNEEFGEVIIAKGEEFEIPSFTAQDASKVGSMQARVYYAYGTKMQTQIGVVNNKFVPEKVGQYAVLYMSKDIYGNLTRRVLELNCVECKNGQALRFYLDKEQEDDLLLREDDEISVSAGKTYKLARQIVESENVFDINISAYCVYNDDVATKVFIDTENREILFNRIGTYKIVYEYGDIVQRKKIVYTVKSCVSDEMTIEKPTLPEYFIKNALYTLDYSPVTFYDSEITRQAAPEVQASFDDKEYVKVDFEKLKINAEKSVKFRYLYQGKVLYQTAEPIPVVDVNFGNKLLLQNYFQGDFTSTASIRNVCFVSNKESGENRLDFINPVSLHAFSLSFEIKEELSNFSALKIELIDYYDRENAIEILYKKNGSKASYEFNGVAYPATNFIGSDSIFYDKSSKGFVLRNGTVIPYVFDLTSDKVIFHLTLQGIESRSGIVLSKLGEQNISDRGYDLSDPTITEKQCVGQWNINEELTIFRPDVTDILSPYVKDNFSITVLAPDGKTPCKDLLSGNDLNAYNASAQTYKIKLSEYGDYTILYQYTDQSGNHVSIMSFITVTDNEKPAFSLEKGYFDKTIVKVKLGNRVNLAGFTASDNYTKSENLRIMILAVTPNFDTVVIDAKDLSYFPQIKGLHTIRYLCVDEAGNYVSVSYKIMVE